MSCQLKVSLETNQYFFGNPLRLPIGPLLTSKLTTYSTGQLITHVNKNHPSNFIYCIRYAINVCASTLRTDIYYKIFIYSLCFKRRYFLKTCVLVFICFCNGSRRSNVVLYIIYLGRRSICIHSLNLVLKQEVTHK